jgi:lysophospholipase L1-like esterase
VTAAGAQRLPRLLDAYRPALLILCHGGNDLLRRSGEEQAAENLRTMVRLARERGAEVVLLGVPRPGLFLSAPDFYADIGRELTLPCDDETLAEILADNARKSDPIHPNARGYAELAAAVADLLRRAGAI